MTSAQYAEILHAIETVYGRKGGAHLIAALPAPVDGPPSPAPRNGLDVRYPVPSSFEHILGVDVDL